MSRGFYPLSLSDEHQETPLRLRVALSRLRVRMVGECGGYESASPHGRISRRAVHHRLLLRRVLLQSGR